VTETDEVLSVTFCCYHTLTLALFWFIEKPTSLLISQRH